MWMDGIIKEDQKEGAQVNCCCDPYGTVAFLKRNGLLEKTGSSAREVYTA